MEGLFTKAVAGSGNERGAVQYPQWVAGSSVHRLGLEVAP